MGDAWRQRLERSYVSLCALYGIAPPVVPARTPFEELLARLKANESDERVLEAAECYLAAGGDPNAEVPGDERRHNQRANLPLLYRAMVRRHARLVRLLLESGARAEWRCVPQDVPPTHRDYHGVHLDALLVRHGMRIPPKMQPFYRILLRLPRDTTDEQLHVALKRLAYPNDGKERLP